MTPAELTAYRDLCRRWPECLPPNVEFVAGGIYFWCRHDLAIKDPVTPVVIHHLETAVLDKHAPGWSYHTPKPLSRRPPAHNYRGIRGPLGIRSVWHDSRLSSLLSACEAVLTKGKTV